MCEQLGNDVALISQKEEKYSFLSDSTVWIRYVKPIISIIHSEEMLPHFHNLGTLLAEFLSIYLFFICFFDIWFISVNSSYK